MAKLVILLTVLLACLACLAEASLATDLASPDEEIDIKPESQRSLLGGRR